MVFFAPQDHEVILILFPEDHINTMAIFHRQCFQQAMIEEIIEIFCLVGTGQVLSGRDGDLPVILKVIGRSEASINDTVVKVSFRDGIWVMSSRNRHRAELSSCNWRSYNV